jgi:hypothetical protein
MKNKLLRRAILACMLVGLIATLPHSALALTGNEGNEDLAQGWLKEFMLTGNLEKARELAAPDFVAYDIMGDMLDLNAFCARVRSLLADTNDRSLEIQALVVEDDMIAVAWSQRGTLTWERIMPWELNGVGILRIEDGQIVEFWFSFDKHAVPGGNP